MLSLNVNVTGQPVVVIGGGPVAQRKVNTLLEAGAQVRVVSPRLTPELQKLWEAGKVEVYLRPYQPGDTCGARLVVVATDSRTVDHEVAAEAQCMGQLVSVAADPHLGSVAFPAQVRRGPVRIAISTDGSSPALARHLRKKLEQVVGPEYGILAQMLGQVREQIRHRSGITSGQRAELFRALVDGPALKRVAQGDEDGAKAIINTQVQAFLAESSKLTPPGIKR